MALTTGEFALLKVLVSTRASRSSRDKLMELARGREHEVFDRAIDVQVSRLRKLVEPDPPTRATSRRCGASATSSCRTAPRPDRLEEGVVARLLPRSATRAVPLFPRTLLWRTFLLIAALILAAVAAYFQIFRTYERGAACAPRSHSRW